MWAPGHGENTASRRARAGKNKQIFRLGFGPRRTPRPPVTSPLTVLLMRVPRAPRLTESQFPFINFPNVTVSLLLSGRDLTSLLPGVGRASRTGAFRGESSAHAAASGKHFGSREKVTAIGVLR